VTASPPDFSFGVDSFVEVDLESQAEKRAEGVNDATVLHLDRFSSRGSDMKCHLHPWM